MAVPARPASGAPIDSVWGGIAHDTAVAQDIQSGVLSHTSGASGAPGTPTAVTFARPFAAPPVVVLTALVASAIGLPCLATTVTTTGFSAVVRRTDGGASAVFPVEWVAIGPRA